MRFPDFFQAATRHNSSAGYLPFRYQQRLACGDTAPSQSESHWPELGTPCESRLINIPTGLGKTAAVVLAWLWNRIALQSPDWPRRLVYCLPMRTLVEQTRDETGKWLERLNKEATKLGLDAKARSDLEWLLKHSPVVLMGGEEQDPARTEWDTYPERPCILIGTQDMLLSRALNRGYGMSRHRWPMHFGLLNNDCLWVMDETQLMGVGVRTSAQLDGFREKLGACGKTVTWWASATLDARLLNTPDCSKHNASTSLGEDDQQADAVHQRVNAVKRLSRFHVRLTNSSPKKVTAYLEELASGVLEKHQPGTTTTVILNRVDRARGLYAILAKSGKKRPLPKCILIHSRFRLLEREKLLTELKSGEEKILVATQAVEAGVDISARTLITELAPWSSLVQRFGRCNRKGEFNESGGADIWWTDIEPEDEKAALPYKPEQLAAARTLLQRTAPSGAAPAVLERVVSAEPLPPAHILRRKDLLDLFDTTPDLAGLDIDVGRFIRDEAERDAQVFWRILKKGEPPDQGIAPLAQELVRVPLTELSGFANKNRGQVWTWSVLDGGWEPAARVTAGQVYLIGQEAGGYSERLGWTGEKEREAFRVLSMMEQPKGRSARDGHGSDDESWMNADAVPPQGQWQSMESHTGQVVNTCQTLIQTLPFSAPWSSALTEAAKWHDFGKTHACFCKFITQGRDDIPEELERCYIAKAPWRPGARHERPHFRHELASALAWLQSGDCTNRFLQSLVAYLVAAHHGKVRLSIRSMPGEQEPPRENNSTDRLYARGIWDGDRLPGDAAKTLFIEGVTAKPISLSLSSMQMGEENGTPSWTARVLSLRDNPSLGVFRLAWLETLLRAADAQASKG